MYLISVIVPCYNVEEYIDRCVDSIVRQTVGVNNLQIILVNDASTDRTLEKLAEWEKLYPDNIFVITYDKNIRQGGARNRGMEIAEGQYIGFVDSDDFVDLQMYETLYKKAEETGADVVRCKFVRDNGVDTDCTLRHEQADVYYEFERKDGYYNHAVESVGNNGEFGGIWSGLYKRDLILGNSVFFPENIRYEDNYWLEVIYLYQKDLYIVDRPMYHYRINNESTVLKRNDESILDKLTIEVMILEFYKAKGIFDSNIDKLFWGFLNRAYIGVLYHVYFRFDYIFIDINELKKILATCFPDYRERAHPDMAGRCTANRMLLEFLHMDEPLSDREQEMLKGKYVELMTDYIRKGCC